MTSTSLGFKIPDPNTLRLDNYDIEINEQSIKSEEAETSWNDQLDVTVFFSIWADIEQLTLQTGFGNTDSELLPDFSFAVAWKSTGSGLHGSSPSQTIVDGENELTFTLAGGQLGQELILRPIVFLKFDHTDGKTPLTPTRIGSRLWETEVRVKLEGVGSQFPTSALDFGQTEIGSKSALWRLKITGDLDSHFSSAVRLYLNTGSNRIQQFLSNPTATSQHEFSSFLEADVVTQLLIFAYNSDPDLLSSSIQLNGSLAEGLYEIHSTYFPNISMDDNAERFKTDPGFLSSAVLGISYSSHARKRRNK